MLEHAQTKTEDRIAGGCLIAGAALVVFAMAHHPTGVDGAGGLAQLVHGVMITLVVVLFFGYARMAQLRGLSRAPVLAGLVAYGVSVGANIGAATISGFLTPALAARGVDPGFFVLCREANQALAYLGAFAISAAIVLWSLDMLMRDRGVGRAIGGIGLLAGLAPAALLAVGHLEMDVHGAMFVYTAQVAWGALVGVRLASGGHKATTKV